MAKAKGLGGFVWYELMTTDARAAEAFYRHVLGWGARDAGMVGMSYTLFSADGADVAGSMALPQEACDAGAGPGWMGYVGVEDVDATAAQAAKAGGTVHRPPMDIPGVGRFAIVADPQGATFALFKAASGSEAQPAAPGTPGHGGWHELHAGEGQSAFGFYADLFGWTKGDAMDMGPMGVYQIFDLDEQMLGGMMTKTEAEPAPFWLYYFNVEGIDAAKARVEAAGGQVTSGPMEVPGGKWIVECLDPQGAIFALVAPGR